ncbi:cupin-like domain-containing protein [Methyloceanibacter sp.]|uniref:cupin-like domain-containing protein n=1 Tax=Methyloceanibacter sp. TaxID=1965321 RepID=UPI002D3D467C|nr:cupin-like domain-containing protein [Methyloceanibacter sp.]HZP07723.1 cupin-like domain-containing protein [Methyloceanibacter sp.]
MSEPIFTSWEEKHKSLWSTQPLLLEHRLHTLSLFDNETLARLIESYPRENYSIVLVGERNARKLWREGEIGGLSGAQVIEAIAAGRMWLNLRSVHTVDKRYAELLDQILDEMRARTGIAPIISRNAGILISSPNAQVYYHADLPGQSLWQIRGTKRVYIYPPVAPFLTPEQIERIILSGVEVDMDYAPWYDEHATVVDLKPGEMAHWPLNSPHRVDNHDCLNVSMTVEYWTDPIRRNVMMNCGNALLRHKLGITPKSHALTGPGFWLKALLQAGAKRSGMLRQQRKAARPVTFRLDPARPGAVINLDQHAA